MNLTDMELQGRCQRFLEAQPHMRKLGLKVIGACPYQVTIELPVQADLFGEGVSTWMHGGMLTTMVDHASSAATLCALQDYELCPTLDLRIDHMSRPSSNMPLFVEAECYRVTRKVLFTRATVYQLTTEQPIAYAISTFMRPDPGSTDPGFKAMIEGRCEGEL